MRWWCWRRLCDLCVDPEVERREAVAKQLAKADARHYRRMMDGFRQQAWKDYDPVKEYWAVMYDPTEGG